MTRRSVYWSVAVVSCLAVTAGTIGGVTGAVLWGLTGALVLILWSRHAM